MNKFYINIRKYKNKKYVVELICKKKKQSKLIIIVNMAQHKNTCKYIL